MHNRKVRKGNAEFTEKNLRVLCEAFALSAVNFFQLLYSYFPVNAAGLFSRKAATPS